MFRAADGADEISHEAVKVDAPFPMPAIEIPVFPKREFVATNYGVTGTDDISDAITKAIAACHDAGGGSVIVPPGRWLTKKIHFQSNVNLHLADGATLLFSEKPDDYLPAVDTQWEGMECYNYSPLIYAFGCTNVAITGHGTLEAKLDVWKIWYARPPAHLAALKQLYEFAHTNAPVEKRQMVAGENHLRPQFIQFNRCKNILIEDVKIRNSPFWVIHLLLCEDAVVRRVDESARGHNNDGIDPDSTRNVLIEDCKLDQGDDDISVKSGMDFDGRRINTPTENIVVRNCTFIRGHELLAVGSDLSGGVRNVYVHDCRYENAPGSAPMHLLLIKTNERRGGFAENIFLENITATATKFGVLGIDTDTLYQWRDLVPAYETHLTPIRNVHVKNITIGETATPFEITGDARLPVRDVFIENVSVAKAHGAAKHYENVENVKETNVAIGQLVADNKTEK
jgi:polygalacturonase